MLASGIPLSILARCYPPPAWPVTCTHTLRLLEQYSHSATCHCPVRDYDCKYANQRRKHWPYMWVEKGCSGLFTCNGRGVLCGRSTSLASTVGVGRVRCNCTAEQGAADAAWITVADAAGALPLGSPALRYYLCRTYGDAAPAEAAWQWRWSQVDVIFIEHLPPQLQAAARRAPVWSLHPPAWALRGAVPLRGLLQRTLPAGGSSWPGPADALKVYRFGNVSRCNAVYQGDPLAGLPFPSACAEERALALAHHANAHARTHVHAPAHAQAHAHTEVHAEAHAEVHVHARPTREKASLAWAPHVIEAGEWLEVLHADAAAAVHRYDDKNARGNLEVERAGLWMTPAAGSGLWYWSGRTVVFRDRDDLLEFVHASLVAGDDDGRAAAKQLSTPQERSSSYAAADHARDMRIARETLLALGFDTISFTHHLDPHQTAGVQRRGLESCCECVGGEAQGCGRPTLLGASQASSPQDKAVGTCMGTYMQWHMPSDPCLTVPCGSYSALYSLTHRATSHTYRTQVGHRLHARADGARKTPCRA